MIAVDGFRLNINKAKVGVKQRAQNSFMDDYIWKCTETQENCRKNIKILQNSSQTYLLISN